MSESNNADKSEKLEIFSIPENDEKDRRQGFIDSLRTGINSCKDIIESQEKVRDWYVENSSSIEELSKEEKEKMAFIISSAEENIAKMKSQIEVLEETLKNQTS